MVVTCLMQPEVNTGGSQFPKMARQRRTKLPAYVERVPLARKRKPDSWRVVGIEVTAIVVAILIGLFAYYYPQNLPFYATKFYAHLGSTEAQHVLSQYYLSQRHENPEAAMEAERWLEAAAAGGHGVAAYNLALGHIRGDLPSTAENATREHAGRVHHLLQRAIDAGIHRAHGLLHICGHGQCFHRQRSLRRKERLERQSTNSPPPSP